MTGGIIIEHIPKIFVLCDRSNTAPLWGYVLREQGLVAILETDLEKAVDHWAGEMPELVVMDLNNGKQDPLELCRQFRSNSVAPILPTYNETQILDAYAQGVDDVIVKPVRPPILVAKLMAWLRRSWVMPTDGLDSCRMGKDRLHHCMKGCRRLQGRLRIDQRKWLRFGLFQRPPPGAYTCTVVIDP